MTFDEFQRLVARAQALDPDYDYGTDPPASEEGNAAAQKALGVRFPPEYVQFVAQYGGGEFALSDVVSVTDGEWNIVDRNRELAIEKFVAISPNGTGDYHGFECVGERCESTVRFFDHETNSLAGSDIATPYDDLFEFLRDDALDFLDDVDA